MRLKWISTCLVGLSISTTVGNSAAWAQSGPTKPQPPVTAPAPLPAAGDDERRGLTLSEIEAIAEAESPNLRQATAALQSAYGKTLQAGLYPNPQALLGAQQLAGKDSQYNAWFYQEVVVKGKLKLDRSAANQEAIQAHFQVIRTRFDLLTNVRQNFYTALAAQQRVKVLTQLVSIATKSKDAAVRLQKAGEGTRADTLLLEIEQERAELALKNARTLMKAAYRQLAASTGSPHMGIDAVEGDLIAKLPDYQHELVKTGVLSQNSLIHIAEAEIQRSRILLQRAQVEPYPNPTFSTGYMREYVGSPDVSMAQVQFPIPLWNRNQGNIQSAHANIHRAHETVNRTQNELLQQLAGAVGRFQASREQTEAYESSILPKARESVKIAQTGYEQGQFDFLRLLQSQRSLAESLLAYINAQESRWLAAAEVAGLTQTEAFPEIPAAEPPPVPGE